MAVEAEAYYYKNGEFLGIQEEQQQIMAWEQQQQLGYTEMGFYRNPVCYSSSLISGGVDVATAMGFLGCEKSLFEKQNQELEWALQFQNEMLSRTLQASSTQNISILLQKYQPYITSLFSQKDEDISTANKNTLILENYLRNMELEIYSWQTKALESEAQIADLNNALFQINERVNGGDEESCCEGESMPVSDDMCRLCRNRRSCVVMLPCRHLCSCELCQGFLGVCPVCAMVKESSLEVLFD